MESEHALRRALPLILAAGVCFSTLDATAKYLVREHGCTEEGRRLLINFEDARVEPATA